MIQPDGKPESLSSEMSVDEQKRLSRRSAVKKAIQGGVALYVAPQILCSELVRAQGVVSGGGGGGGGGTDVTPFLAVPLLGGLAAGGGGAGAAAALPALLAEAPGGGIAPGTTIAEGGVPGAAGTPGSPLGPAGPRATLPPEPLRRGRNKRKPKATQGPKRAIRGLW
jgi:hypothetical protein